MLVGQQDRGFYLGVPERGHPTRPYRLVFIPAAEVARASSEKQLARVIPRRAASRRKRLGSRPGDVTVR
jgi:hypothetical protein